MSDSTNIPIIAAMAFAGLLGHFALVVAARWLNIVFLGCAAFVLISPLSVARDLGGVIELIKWGRVYTSLLIIGLYLLSHRSLRLGPAGCAFILFLAFYSLAGIWSHNPPAAIQFKGMYALVVIAGVLAAASVRDFAEFRSDLRVLFVAGAVYALFVTAGIAASPGTLLSGRLVAWGWNANRLGHDAAAMLAISLFVGLYDPAKSWKLMGIALTGFFAFIVLATGSRGAAGMALISAVILAAPLFRRPVLLTTLALIGGALVNLILGSIASSTIERLGEVDFSNRAVMWTRGLNAFADSPLIGAGWVADDAIRAGGTTTNLHSMYIQILAETGLVGAALFLLMLVVCGFRSLGLLNALRRFPGAAPYAFFAFALAGATLAHGAAESSSIQGTNLNGLLLPFAIGLLDRIPQMIREAAHGHQPSHEDDPGAEYVPYGEDTTEAA